MRYYFGAVDPGRGGTEFRGNMDRFARRGRHGPDSLVKFPSNFFSNRAHWIFGRLVTPFRPPLFEDIQCTSLFLSSLMSLPTNHPVSPVSLFLLLPLRFLLSLLSPSDHLDMRIHQVSPKIYQKRFLTSFFNTLEPLWKSDLHCTQVSAAVATLSCTFCTTHFALCSNTVFTMHTPIKTTEKELVSNLQGKAMIVLSKVRQKYCLSQ